MRLTATAKSDAVDAIPQQFGIELELGDPGYDEDRYCDDCDDYNCGCFDDERGDHTEMVQNVISWADRFDLLDADDFDRLHPYHCSRYGGCDNCNPERTDWFLTAQEDGTVAMEFISKIARLDNPDDRFMLTRLSEFLNRIYERHYMHRPDRHDNWGNHIHVVAPPRLKTETIAWIAALMATAPGKRFELLGSGGRSGLRGYNAKPERGYQGAWVADKQNTVEIRLWNTPTDGSYIPFHVATSIALVRWGYAQAVAHSSFIEYTDGQFFRSFRFVDRLQQQIDQDQLAYILADIVDMWPADDPDLIKHRDAFMDIMLYEQHDRQAFTSRTAVNA